MVSLFKLCNKKNQSCERLFAYAPLEKDIEVEKRLEKKLNHVNSFKNLINNIKELNQYFNILQITNKTFYFNKFSFLTKNSLKAMGRFRIQLLVEDNTWSTRYNTTKTDQYSNSSNDWTLFSLNFTVEIYGIILIYDQIEKAHANMCFSKITITHSVD